MILDTSAAVAMLCSEPEAEAFLDLMDAAGQVRMSVASVLELTMVIRDQSLADEFLQKMQVLPHPVDVEQLRWAQHAFQVYGRGSGSPARLNFGDCFSYAAAKALGQPLLFTGEDFIHTDVRRAHPQP